MFDARVLTANEGKEYFRALTNASLFPEIYLFLNHVANYTVHNAQFSVGASLSGAPLHHHTEAFNHLLYGQKKWMMYNRRFMMYSNIPAWELWRVKEKLPPPQWQCTQKAFIK